MATFVLVHGGGHGAWCWDRLTPLLRAEGHAVHTPVLTGVGERFGELTPEVSLSTHLADVVSLIEGEDLRDVILAGHSYGGIVITGVAGRIPERIAELVFLDAPHPRNGETLEDASPGMRAALEPQKRTIYGAELVLFPTDETIAIYGLHDPEDVAWAKQRLTPHPWKCFTEPLRLEHEAAMLAIPRTSIDCLETIARRGLITERSRSAQRYQEIDTGHDLMITEPRAVADILLEVASARTI
jgi:pimeloyl-ACP methyl ester carboxylesterase